MTEFHPFLTIRGRSHSGPADMLVHSPNPTVEVGESGLLTGVDRKFFVSLLSTYIASGNVIEGTLYAEIWNHIVSNNYKVEIYSLSKNQKSIWHFGGGWFRQKIQMYIFSCPKQLNRWPCHSLTHSLTHSTFTFDIQRANPETCDLWDIWSEW